MAGARGDEAGGVSDESRHTHTRCRADLWAVGLELELHELG